MGLKDLVAQKAAMTEETIEKIVSDYVRFDTDEMEIVFTPEFASLNSKAKVLVYLVALQGWPFVTDEAVETSAKPAAIGEAVAIPGGTLRPLLKELKDNHLIMAKGGAYSVRASHLQSLEDSIAAAQRPSTNTGGSRKRKTKKKKAEKVAKKAGKTTPKKAQAGVGEKFLKLVEDGFFDEGRTSKDVRDKFHEAAIIIPHTSIPKYVNKGVRDELLTRKKEDVDGRQVWVYRTKK